MNDALKPIMKKAKGTHDASKKARIREQLSAANAGLCKPDERPYHALPPPKGSPFLFFRKEWSPNHLNAHSSPYSSPHESPYAQQCHANASLQSTGEVESR
jgi:hypothetical protein